ITYGKDRTEAIQNMLKAIDDYIIEGVNTTLPFGHFVFTHPAFLAGDFSTGFIQKYYTPEVVSAIQEKGAKLAAQLALFRHLQKAKKLRLPYHSLTKAIL